MFRKDTCLWHNLSYLSNSFSCDFSSFSSSRDSKAGWVPISWRDALNFSGFWYWSDAFLTLLYYSNKLIYSCPTLSSLGDSELELILSPLIDELDNVESLEFSENKFNVI